jgi:hypothetical protein
VQTVRLPPNLTRAQTGCVCDRVQTVSLPPNAGDATPALFTNYEGTNCVVSAQPGDDMAVSLQEERCKRCRYRPSWQVLQVWYFPRRCKLCCIRPGWRLQRVTSASTWGANGVATAQVGKRLPLLGKVYEGMVNACLWVANLTRTPQEGWATRSGSTSQCAALPSVTGQVVGCEVVAFLGWRTIG